VDGFDPYQRYSHRDEKDQKEIDNLLQWPFQPEGMQIKGGDPAEECKCNH
jgi:hypothetical protein